MTKNISTLLVLLALPLAAVYACGSDSDGGSKSGKFLSSCNSSGQPCTADTSQYEQCLIGKCDADFSACYGAGYKTGTFSGPCGPYINCMNACPCDAKYNSCVMNCTPQATTECQACGQKTTTCIQNSGCVDPCAGGGGSAGNAGSGTGGSGLGGSGLGGGGGGSGKTCADLLACCAALSGEAKTSCEGVANGGNETNCATVASYLCK